MEFALFGTIAVWAGIFGWKTLVAVYRGGERAEWWVVTGGTILLVVIGSMFTWVSLWALREALGTLL